MRRRCFFIGTPLQRTAVSAHFQALAHELVRRGHESVTIAPPGECEPDPATAKFHVHAWPSNRPTRVADATFLWRLINRYRPDCLLANFAPVNWMCVIGWLKKVRHRIGWYHTLSTQIDGDWTGSRGRLRWLRLRKMIVYGRATHIAVNSQAALEDAHQTFGVSRAKCSVWRNSLPDPRQSITLRSGSDREDLVICAGRFDRTKGHDVLVEALAMCASELGATKVEFLGVGSLMEETQRQVRRLGLAERCRFRGVVPHDEVLRRMAVAKVVVVPSRSEAFGLVNIEAMSVGTPVVASAVDGITEIVRDGDDGCLVPPENPRALADQLVAVLADAALRERLGWSARQRFVAVYEQSKVVSAQADWLESLTGVLPQPATHSQSPDEQYALKV